jgi:PAS domain S-box-containing protein
MVIVNRYGAIVLVNAQTERLFGYPRAELLGQTVEKRRTFLGTWQFERCP